MNKTTITINGEKIEVEEKKTEHTIFYKESAIQSFLSDLFSFSFLIVTFWFNYKFIDGNNILDFLLLIIFIALLSARSSVLSKRFTSKKDLLEYIEKEIGE